MAEGPVTSMTPADLPFLCGDAVKFLSSVYRTTVPYSTIFIVYYLCIAQHCNARHGPLTLLLCGVALHTLARAPRPFIMPRSVVVVFAALSLSSLLSAVPTDDSSSLHDPVRLPLRRACSAVPAPPLLLSLESLPTVQGVSVTPRVLVTPRVAPAVHSLHTHARSAPPPSAVPPVYCPAPPCSNGATMFPRPSQPAAHGSCDVSRLRCAAVAAVGAHR